jgi:hypothetical protein
MERLTGRDAYGDIVANEEMQIIASRGTTYDDLHNIINHLAEKLCEYEDLEEQGRLPKLPCKVGDTVYYINPNENTINELVVYSFDIRPLQHFACDYMGARLNFNQFGKTVFLTREEAETKLKELRDINSETNRNKIKEIER